MDSGRWYPLGDSLSSLLAQAQACKQPQDTNKAGIAFNFTGLLDVPTTLPPPHAVEISQVSLGHVGDSLDVTGFAFPVPADTILHPTKTTTANNAAPRCASAMVFSADGAFLALGCSDGVVIVQEWATGNIVFVLKAHTAIISDIAFSHDGTRIATISYDLKLRVWRTSNGDMISERGFEVIPRSVEFCPADRQILVLTFALGTAKILHSTAGWTTLLSIEEGAKGEVDPVAKWYAEAAVDAKQQEEERAAIHRTDATTNDYNAQNHAGLQELKEYEGEVTGHDTRTSSRIGLTTRSEVVQPPIGINSLTTAPTPPANTTAATTTTVNEVVGSTIHAITAASRADPLPQEDGGASETALSPSKRKREPESQQQQQEYTLQQEDALIALSHDEEPAAKRARFAESMPDESGETASIAAAETTVQQSSAETTPNTITNVIAYMEPTEHAPIQQHTDAAVPADVRPRKIKETVSGRLVLPRLGFDSATAATFVNGGNSIVVGTGRGLVILYTLAFSQQGAPVEVKRVATALMPSKVAVQQLHVIHTASHPLHMADAHARLHQHVIATGYGKALRLFAIHDNEINFTNDITDLPDGMWKCSAVSRDGGTLLLMDRGKQRPKVHCYKGFVRFNAGHSGPNPEIVYCKTKNAIGSLKISPGGLAVPIQRMAAHPFDCSFYLGDKAGRLQVWRYTPAPSWDTYAPQLQMPEMMYNTPYKIVVDPANPAAALPPLPQKRAVAHEDPMHVAVDVVAGYVRSPKASGAAIPVRFDEKIVTAVYAPFARTMPSAQLDEFGISITAMDSIKSPAHGDAASTLTPRPMPDKAAFVTSSAYTSLVSMHEPLDPSRIPSGIKDADPFAAVPLVTADGHRYVPQTAEEAVDAVFLGLVNEGVQSVLRVTSRDVPIHWLPEPNEVPEVDAAVAAMPNDIMEEDGQD